MVDGKNRGSVIEQEKGLNDPVDEGNSSTKQNKMPYTKPIALQINEALKVGRGVISCGLGSGGT